MPAPVSIRNQLYTCGYRFLQDAMASWEMSIQSRRPLCWCSRFEASPHEQPSSTQKSSLDSCKCANKSSIIHCSTEPEQKHHMRESIVYKHFSSKILRGYRVSASRQLWQRKSSLDKLQSWGRLSYTPGRPFVLSQSWGVEKETQYTRQWCQGIRILSRIERWPLAAWVNEEQERGLSAYKAFCDPSIEVI